MLSKLLFHEWKETQRWWPSLLLYLFWRERLIDGDLMAQRMQSARLSLQSSELALPPPPHPPPQRVLPPPFGSGGWGYLPSLAGKGAGPRARPRTRTKGQALYSGMLGKEKALYAWWTIGLSGMTAVSTTDILLTTQEPHLESLGCQRLITGDLMDKGRAVWHDGSVHHWHPTHHTMNLTWSPWVARDSSLVTSWTKGELSGMTAVSTTLAPLLSAHKVKTTL